MRHKVSCGFSSKPENFILPVFGEGFVLVSVRETLCDV